MKYGLAISSYLNEKIYDSRLNVMLESFNSLVNSNFDGEIFLIDDCSTVKDHLSKIESDYKFKIIERKENGGYSKTKNNGLKVLMDNDCDVLFLSDDDILYKDVNWFEKYLEAMEVTKLPHFCLHSCNYAGYNKEDNSLNINGYEISVYNSVQGGFMTFTKELIKDHGYFKIMPRKLGYEHCQYTFKLIHNKVIPAIIDIKNSTDFVDYVDCTGEITTRPDDWLNMISENYKYLYADFDKIEDCII